EDHHRRDRVRHSKGKANDRHRVCVSPTIPGKANRDGNVVTLGPTSWRRALLKIGNRRDVPTSDSPATNCAPLRPIADGAERVQYWHSSRVSAGEERLRPQAAYITRIGFGGSCPLALSSV